MKHIYRDGARVKSPAYPQKNMERAARRFRDAAAHVLDLSKVSRITLDRSRIAAEFIDGSTGVIGEY